MDLDFQNTNVNLEAVLFCGTTPQVEDVDTLKPELPKVYMYKITRACKTDLLNMCSEDCVCQMSKNANAIYLVCFSSWICRLYDD